MKRTFYILVFLLNPALSLWAQKELPLSAQQILELVQENNRSLMISEQDLLAARAQYRQTQSVFLPNISLSHNGMTTNNPLMAFGAKLNQEVVSQADFDPARLNDPERIDLFATRLEVEQPLINLDGLYRRSAARDKMKATALHAKRTKQHLLLEAEKAYMQLQLAQQAVSVMEKALKKAQASKKVAENHLKQGYLQKADLLEVEVRLNEVRNQLQYTRSQLENTRAYLRFLTGIQEEGSLIAVDPLEPSQPLAAFEELSSGRADLQAVDLAAEAQRKMLKAEQAGFLPRLNAYGSYELYDDTAFQGRANGYAAGLSLSWNLFEGSSRLGRMAENRATYRKAELEAAQYRDRSHLEFGRAQRALQDAENKLRLSRLAMEQSQEALRIRSNRFEQGLEKTADLLASESKYATKQLEYHQTVFEYNYALEYLEFLSEDGSTGLSRENTETTSKIK